MTKIWIATYVDHSDTCNGKAGVLGTCLTKEEAQAEVRADIEKWCDDHAGEDYAVDFDCMRTYFSEIGDGCEWNITEDEVDLYERA